MNEKNKDRIEETEKYIEFLNEISSKFEEAGKKFNTLKIPGYTISALEVASEAVHLATDLAMYSLHELKRG